MSTFSLNDHQYQPTPKQQVLWIALILAVIVHIMVLWYFNLPSLNNKETRTRSFDVTLTTIPVTKTIVQAPKQVAEKTPNTPLPEKNAQSTQQQVKLAVNNVKKPAAINHVERKILTEPKTPEISQKPEIAEVSDSTVAARPKLTADDLQQQIAQIGKRISNDTPNFADTKIKFVNEVRDHKFLANQYAKDFDNKVERTGNLNYPEAARNLKQAQTLTMDIGINADGSLYSMRVVKSSGNPALDEAAKRIVKMSTPFAELPVDLQHEANVLVITRSWKFSDETGLTTH